MVQIAGQLAGQAWQSGQEHTVYFEPASQTAGPGDPRRRTVCSAKHGIAYDHIPASAPLRRLYESDDMTAFIAAALGKDRLYRSAGPLDALQITTFEPGDELGWHFDRSEFSVTVMYAPADSGGEFVYVPGLRSDQAPNYDQVAAVLAGTRPGCGRCPTAPARLAVVVAGLALLDMAVSLAQRWYSARIGEGLIYDLRTQVFDHVQRLPVAFFLRIRTGELISRLNGDIIAAQRALTNTLSGVVSSAVSLIIVLVTMVVLSWQVTVIALALVAVFIVPAKWVGEKLQLTSRTAGASSPEHS